MDDDKKGYCGFENGDDWLDDIAIEEHQLTEHMQNENLQPKKH